MKENEHVELEGISPFNRFFFRSCYFHQLLACYMYFGVMPEMVIGNYLNLYVLEDGHLRTKEIQVFDKKAFEVLTGIRQIKFLPQQPIQDVLVEYIRNGVPVIIVVDCYYIPFRADTFGKIHTDHYITVCGYNAGKKTFIILEHESEKDFRYVKHEISSKNLVCAFQFGVRCIQRGRDPFITFEKKHAPDEEYFAKLRAKIRGFSEEIDESYRVMKKYFSSEGLMDKFKDEDRIVYKDLYWQKLRQMHQFTFMYPKRGREIKKIFLEIINTYLKFSTYCNEAKKGDLIKKELEEQVKIIFKKEYEIRCILTDSIPG